MMEAARSAKFAAPSHPYSSALFRRLRAHLQRGGVIAYATESCYGLGCDPRNYQAVRQLLKIKGRPVNKGLILIGAKFAQLESFVAPLNEQEKNSLKQFWPGPVTLLMPAARHTPKWLTGRHTSIAVRVTAHLDAAYLCRQLDMALVSTSANRAGRTSLKTAAACRKTFGSRVCVLPGIVGMRRRPSTILDFKSGWVLRK
jgi:L-threonylcarbamoyladenylate synthase